MKSMSRRYAIPCVILALILLFASACSNNGNPSASSPSPSPSATTTSNPSAEPSAPPAQEPVTVTVWVGSWWESKIPEIKERYKQVAPHVTLEFGLFPSDGYLNNAITAELGGNSPDVLDLSVDELPNMAGTGMLEPWDDYIDGLDIDDFYPGNWNSGYIDGKLYAIPNRADGFGLYYNKKMFDDANIAYPTADWTPDDLLEMAKKITVPGQKYGFSMSAKVSDPRSVLASFAPVLWYYGGDFLDETNTKAVINTPEAIQAMTWWSELYTQHKVVPEGSVNYTFSSDVQPMFLANQVAMVPAGVTILGPLKDHPDVSWGVAKMPFGYTTGIGWSFTIPKSAKHKEAGRDFVRWFVEPENLGQLDPRFPARKSASAYEPWNDESHQALVENAMPYTRFMPAIKSWGEIQTVIVTELQKLLIGLSNPQETAKVMEDEINAILKKQ